MDNFLPSIGTLERYSIPEGPQIRLDSGYEEGMEIPIYYDPMIAKLITKGKTRAEAISVMLEVIAQSEIKGIENTLPFGKFVFEHDAFVSGNFDTHFVKKYFQPELIKEKQKEEAEVAAHLAYYIYKEQQRELKVPQHESSEWLNNR